MKASSIQQLSLTSANNGQPPDIDSALRQIFLASSGRLISSGSNNVMTSQQLFTNTDNRKIAKIQSQIYQFFEEPYQSGELMTGAMTNSYTQASTNGIPEAASKAIKREQPYTNKLQSYIVSIGNSLIKNYQKKGVKTSNLAHFRTPLYEYLSMSTGLANTVERRTMVVTYLGLSGLGRTIDLTGDDKVDYKDITQAWRISYQAPQRSQFTSPTQTVQNPPAPAPSVISTPITQAAQNNPPPPLTNVSTVTTQAVQNDPAPPIMSTVTTQAAQNDPPPQLTNVSTITTQAVQNDPAPPVMSTVTTQTVLNNTTSTASRNAMTTRIVQNSTTPIIKGDINFDGKVDNADLRLLKEALKGQIILGSQQIMAPDLDFDGLTTKKDKRLLRKMIRNR